MFSRKKIAAVTALLGGLAVTGAVAPQAYAAEASRLCASSVQGSAMCPPGGADPANEESSYRISQVQSCMPTNPLEVPVRGLLNPGSTKLGPSIHCSNQAPGAEGQ
jgi:hypothetical protein